MIAVRVGVFVNLYRFKRNIAKGGASVGMPKLHPSHIELSILNCLLNLSVSCKFLTFISH
jgi:hypothetical protein